MKRRGFLGVLGGLFALGVAKGEEPERVAVKEPAKTVEPPLVWSDHRETKYSWHNDPTTTSTAGMTCYPVGVATLVFEPSDPGPVNLSKENPRQSFYDKWDALEPRSEG